MRPALAVAVVLSVVACKKAADTDGSASSTALRWEQKSADGRYQIRQTREASGCTVQVVTLPGEKPLWSSKTCLPTPSGLVFLSPNGEKVLVLDLFPSAMQAADWSKVNLVSLWTKGIVSRQYTGAELLARDRVVDMRLVLSWLKGATYEELKTSARPVGGGAQVSVDLIDGRTVLLGFEGAALPAPPASSAVAAAAEQAPAAATPAPSDALAEPDTVATGSALSQREAVVAGDDGLYRWEDERGGLHFSPGSQVPARFRGRAVRVNANVQVVTVEHVQAPPAGQNPQGGSAQPGAQPAPGQPAPGAQPAAGAQPAPGGAAATGPQ